MSGLSVLGLSRALLVWPLGRGGRPRLLGQWDICSQACSRGCETMSWAGLGAGAGGAGARGGPRKAGGQATAQSLPHRGRCPGADASLQRPRPGQEGWLHSVSDDRPEGRWSALWALLLPLGLRFLKPQGSIKLPFPFVALAEVL